MICREPAPCALWGNGSGARDHCNAHEEDPVFLQMRKEAHERRKAQGSTDDEEAAKLDNLPDGSDTQHVKVLGLETEANIMPTKKENKA